MGVAVATVFAVAANGRYSLLRGQRADASACAVVIIGAMSTGELVGARMTSVESPATSSRLNAAAAAERARLEREAVRVETRTAAAAAELQRLVDAREAIRERLALLDQLSPSRPQQQLELGKREPTPAAEPPNGYLRGARIRTVAVHLLSASDRADHPIHYSDWFALLEHAGFGVAGKDPVAAFLTQLTRSPVIQKANGPGFYRLDLSAVRDLQRRLRELQDELLRLHEGQQTLEDIASARERRTEVTAELARTERALEEALRALGPEPSGE